MSPPKRRGKSIIPAENDFGEKSHEDEANANPPAASRGNGDESMARLRVHYEEGETTYNSAEEATADMASRGLSVKVIEGPDTLWERVQQAAWQPARPKRRNPAANATGFKQKLQAFRRISLKEND
uniref:Uncharacterized protein n=1 Tax=Knipowitschia caucasica TaxID=637954 RepID=A0AAV2K5Y3_KNICA